MTIGLGDIGKVVNIAGGLNPNAKKVSSTFNFVKSMILSGVIFIIGIFLFLFAWPVGLILILISVSIFIISMNKKKRINSILKMREELMNDLTNDEVVSCFFADIDSGNSTSNSSGVNEDLENVMILTNKRIVFVHIPRIGMSDVTGGNFLRSVGNAVSLDGLRNKVEEELKIRSLCDIVQSSRKAYSMNYSEISEVKINNFFSKVVFVYRDRKYRYFIRKKQLGQFREIFKNYIKQ